jgi:DNA-binding phage protein
MGRGARQPGVSAEGPESKMSRQNVKAKLAIAQNNTQGKRERKLMKKIVEVLANREELIDRSLGIVLSKIHAAIAERGVCTIAAAGGSTPEPLYRALSTQTCLGTKFMFSGATNATFPQNTRTAIKKWRGSRGLIE